MQIQNVAELALPELLVVSSQARDCRQIVVLIVFGQDDAGSGLALVKLVVSFSAFVFDALLSLAARQARHLLQLLVRAVIVIVVVEHPRTAGVLTSSVSIACV